MNETPVTTFGWWRDEPGEAGNAEHCAEPGPGGGGPERGKLGPTTLPLRDALEIAGRALDRGVEERKIWCWLAHRTVDVLEES